MTNHKGLALLFGLLFSFSFVFAHESADIHLDSIDAEQVKILEEAFVGQEVPYPLSSFFGNERVNILVTKKDGEKLTVGIESENGKVTAIKVGALRDPTLMIRTEEAAIKAIVEAENPLAMAREARKHNKLEYKAIGFKSRMKFFAVFKLSPLAGLFKESIEPEQVDENTVVVNGVEGNAERNGGSEGLPDSEGAATELPAPTAPKPTAVASEVTGAVTALPPAPTQAETQPQEPAEPEGPATHTVKLTNAGFEKYTITINVGDTITFVNNRSASLNTAFMIGTRECRELKSKIFKPGESYSYTFTKPLKCVIADGIYTKQSMTVMVE